MDDRGVELVCVGKVEIEVVTTPEPFGAQGAVVKAMRGMKDESVVLEFTVTGCREDTVLTVERWQEWRHISVGEC